MANKVRKLMLNADFNIQFEGDFHKNGYPKLIAKNTNLPNSVKVLQEMVDYWNERQTKSKETTVVPKLVWQENTKGDLVSGPYTIVFQGRSCVLFHGKLLKGGGWILLENAKTHANVHHIKEMAKL